MPPRGQTKALSASLSPARRELAQAVRALLQNAGGSQRSIAGQLLISRSSFNRFSSGKVIPDEKTLLDLRQLVERKKRAGFVSEDDLRSLRQRALEESVAVEPAADTVTPAQDEVPAAPAAGTGALPVAPVLTTEGDRRNGSVAGVQWPVDELALHLDSGRYEHAVGMLDYAGDEAPASESAAAIQACRNRGLTEATDTLLRKVGSRPEKDVIAVVDHLMEANNIRDARALIRCNAQKV